MFVFSWAVHCCVFQQRWGGLLEGRMVSSLIAIQRGCTSTAAVGIELQLCFAIYDHRLSMLMLLFFMTEDQADASVYFLLLHSTCFFWECISCFFPRLCAVNYFGSVLSMSFVNSTARLKSSDDDVTFALVVVRSKIQPRFTSP